MRILRAQRRRLRHFCVRHRAIRLLRSMAHREAPRLHGECIFQIQPLSLRFTLSLMEATPPPVRSDIILYRRPFPIRHPRLPPAPRLISFSLRLLAPHRSPPVSDFICRRKYSVFIHYPYCVHPARSATSAVVIRLNNMRISRRGQSITELLLAIAVRGDFHGGSRRRHCAGTSRKPAGGKHTTGRRQRRRTLNNVRVWSESGWSNVTALATGSAYNYYLITSSSPYAATSGIQSIVVGTTDVHPCVLSCRCVSYKRRQCYPLAIGEYYWSLPQSRSLYCIIGLRG